jgi:hypothetical protein
MDIASAQSEAFKAARISTATIVNAAGGWCPRIRNEELMVSSSFFIYLYDQQTKWCWMCSIPKSAFQEAAQRLPSSTPAQAAGGVSELVSKAASGNEEENWEEVLSLLLVAYLRGTATFSSATTGSGAPHFVVIRYGAASMVRPFAVNGNDRFPLSVDRVLGAVDYVMKLDRVNHPEWIKS